LFLYNIQGMNKLMRVFSNFKII